MNISIAFSPCPNDTFIFDALVNRLIDTKGINFEVQLEDVQTLNQKAIAGEIDVSKISYGVLPLVLKHYHVLASGGALGKGVGPLLVSKTPINNVEHAMKGLSVAIPGVNTTAHMLFSMAFPQAKKKEFVVFNQVEELVLSGAVDTGVIIHENRFTYQEKGLFKLIDLGNYWEQETGAPIPLGGIVIKKSFDEKLKKTINNLIRESVSYAFDRYPTLGSYVREHAQEMDENVMRQHIDLYVNDYSLDLGEKGEQAIKKVMEVYRQLNPHQTETEPIVIVR